MTRTFEVDVLVTGIVKVRLIASSSRDAATRAPKMVRTRAHVERVRTVDAIVAKDPPPAYKGKDPKIAVHTSHCCLWHGCKYTDPKCVVVAGKYAQEHPCESCEAALGSDDD